jgi:hypothetical protein
VSKERRKDRKKSTGVSGDDKRRGDDVLRVQHRGKAVCGGDEQQQHRHDGGAARLLVPAARGEESKQSGRQRHAAQDVAVGAAQTLAKRQGGVHQTREQRPVLPRDSKPRGVQSRNDEADIAK